MLATRLDRELAGGADPGADPALELRARRLLTLASRWRLADGIETIVSRAADTPSFSSRVPLRRAAILGARPEIESLIAELSADHDCSVRGIALVRLLLTDGDSPLYRRGPDGELLAAIREAHGALRLEEST